MSAMGHKRTSHLRFLRDETVAKVPKKKAPAGGWGAWSRGFQFGMERNIHTHATCQPDFNGFQD